LLGEHKNMRDHGSAYYGPVIVEKVKEEDLKKEKKENGNDTSIVPEGHTGQEDPSGS
jgi:hypothetical protein